MSKISFKLILLVATIGFLLLPLAVIIPVSFVDSRFLQFPPEALSLRWYKNFFGQQSWHNALLNSLTLGALTTVGSVVLGTLASLALVRGQFPGKRVVWVLFLSPIVVPQILIAIAIYGLYLRLGMVGSITGIAAAHTLLAMPYTILLVSEALKRLDPDIERAARIFGATPWRTFWIVTLPQLLPAVVTSAVFSFFVSFDELVVTLFVKGTMNTIPTRVWSDLRYEISPTIAAVASLLVSVTLASMLLIEVLRRRSAGSDPVREN
ncbi:MAG: ABC transporter permease [Xanthobacteraceae bacterium]